MMMYPSMTTHWICKFVLVYHSLQILNLPTTSSAIATNEIKTRRATLSSFVSVSTLALVNPTEIVNAATAADQDDRIVVPGTGMKPQLKNVIIDEDGSSSGGNGGSISSQQTLITQLAKSRIGAKELSPLNPSLTPFAADNELFYGVFYVFYFRNDYYKEKEYHDCFSLVVILFSLFLTSVPFVL